MNQTNCYYITKTNKVCNIKFKLNYNINNKFYCKKHFDLINKNINKKCENLKCNYITKTKNKCMINSKIDYNINNQYYCKKHFELLNKTINNKSDGIKNTNNEDNNIKNEIEKDKIMHDFQKIYKIPKINTNKNIIRKNIFQLLLKVHPDKCRINTINSHEITQDLNKLLNEIKLL
jgi:hypothetical protein